MVVSVNPIRTRLNASAYMVLKGKLATVIDTYFILSIIEESDIFFEQINHTFKHIKCFLRMLKRFWLLALTYSRCNNYLSKN